MIKITIGISNAGKSYWSHQEWLKDPLNTIIVSRDNIRYMFGYTEATVYNYYLREDIAELENEVTRYQDTLIAKALSKGRTVIIDATNLKQSYLK